MRFPSRTGWGQPGNSKGPPDHNTTQHNHQAAVNTSYPEKQTRTWNRFFFLKMQLDLPRSFRNSANKMLPESADLVPAAGAATVTFNKSYTDIC